MNQINRTAKALLGVVATLATMLAAQAQVEITLTGSTAFRADVYRAIRTMFDAGFLENAASFPAGGGPPATASNPTNAGLVTWTGTMTPLFGASAVTVRASWSGSVAGIRTVAQNLTVAYLSSSTSGNTNTVNLNADFAFADNSQGNTLFTTPTLSDTIFGVVPFTWAKSPGAPAALDNISTMLAQGILPGGNFPLWQFSTNLPVDASLVYSINRDTGSGTRVVTFAESGYGVFTPSTGSKLVNTANCALGFTTDTVGFSSGGNVVGQLNASTCLPAIGYLGINDALTVTGQPASWLKWNGVPYSKTAIQNGQYTFWGYEHIMNRTPLGASEATWRGTPTNPLDPSTAPANSFLNKVNTELASSPGAVQLGTMNVQRAIEGGVVTP